MAAYRVDVYHINIETGDSQLLVLIEINNALPGGGSPVKVVLIDGGENLAGAENSIYDLLNSVAIIYNPLVGGNVQRPNTFILSAIVTTHFHSDHVGGISRYLVNAQVVPNAPRLNTYEQCEFLGGTLDPDVYGRTRPIVPLYAQTRLYDPGFRPPARRGRYAWTTYLNVTTAQAAIPPLVDRGAVARQTPNTPPPVNQSYHVGKELFWGPILSYPIALPVPPAVLPWPPGGAALRFTDPPAIRAWTNATYPVAGDPGNIPIGSPALYCVADNNVPITSITDVVGAASSATNRTSLILILCSNTDRILHYFAGDSEDAGESQVARWIANWFARLPAPIPRSFAMKCSHHGAYSSTSVTFMPSDPLLPPPITPGNPASSVGILQTLQPKYLAISNGRDEDHPSWELLYMLYFYNSITINNGGVNDGQRCYQLVKALMTNYPNYLQAAVPPAAPFGNSYARWRNELATRLGYMAFLQARLGIAAPPPPPPPTGPVPIDGLYYDSGDMYTLLVNNVITDANNFYPYDNQYIVNGFAASPRILYYRMRFDPNTVVPYSPTVTVTRRNAAALLIGDDPVPPPVILGLDTSTYIYIESPSTPPAGDYYVLLPPTSVTCAFYNFVNNLDGKYIVLGSTAKPSGSMWNLPYSPVSEILGSYLKSTGLTVNFQINNAIVSNTNSLDVSKATITINGSYEITNQSIIYLGGAFTLLDIPSINFSPSSAQSINVVDALVSMIGFENEGNFLNSFFNISVNVSSTDTIIVYSPINNELSASIAVNIPVIPIMKQSSSIGVAIGSADDSSSVVFNKQTRTTNNITLDDPVVEASISSTGSIDAQVDFVITLLDGSAIKTTATFDFSNTNIIITLTENLTANSLKTTVDGMFGNGVYSSANFGTYINIPSDVEFGMSVNLNLYPLSLQSTTFFADVSFNSAILPIPPADSLNISASITFPGPIVAALVDVGANTVSKFYPPTSSPMKINASEDLLASLQFASIDAYFDFKNGAYHLSAAIDGQVQVTTWLVTDSITIELDYDSTNTTNKFDFSVTCTISLSDTPGENQVAILADYNSSGWSFSGGAQNFYIQDLANAMSPTIADDIRQIIPDMIINNFDLLVDLGAGTFDVSAEVTLGGIIIDFTYNYTKAVTGSSPSDEINSLIIGIEGSGPTESISVDLGELMSDLGFTQEAQDLSGIIINIPPIIGSYDFVNKIFVLNASGNSSDPSSIQYELTIVRILNTATTPTTTKTMVWFSITPPQLQNVPVIGTLEFPIDNFFLVYSTALITTTDFTNIENALNNSSIKVDDSFLSLKNQYSKSGSTGMLSGLQACIAYQGSDGTTDLLTYVFGPTAGVDQVVPTPSSSGATWFNYQKTLGPIQISRVGLDYDGTNLYLLVDGSLLLDVIQVNLQGFYIGIPCPKFKLSGLTIGLTGLGIDISDGPLTIDGAFANMGSSVSGFSSLYEGGLTIGTSDFNLSAIGAYGITSSSGNASFFIFGQLLAALGDPTGTGLAFVTGISAGFGYNQFLTPPTATQVQSFPLISGSLDSSPPPTPMDLLNTLLQINIPGSNPQTPWINPTVGEKWFAAGLQITSWELVDTRALLIVEFGTDTDISILARSVMNLPRDTGTDGFVYLELDISASLNFGAGTLTLLGAISSNSFVFTTSCKISGGFAIYSWFNPSQYSGDFVATIGGYHPSFSIPAWYPRVDRLQLNWQIPGDCISATGDLYFAVVPNCAMGGGSLNYQYNGGWVSASFLAEVNGIVYWDPFSFDVQVGVSIDARGKIGWGWFSYSFDVEISADIEIWGPPVGGHAEAEVCGYHFGIDFGSSRQVNTLTTWAQFRKSLPQGSTSQTEDDNDKTQYLQIKIISGLITPQGSSIPDNSNATAWIVSSSNFQFQVISNIPITGNVTYYSETQPQTITSSQANINLAPLNVTNFGSSLLIEIDGKEEGDGEGDVYNWIPVEQADIAGWTGGTVPLGLTYGYAPGAIWGTPPTNPQTTLNQNGVIPNINGICLQVFTEFNNVSPDPVLFTDLLESPTCPGVALDYGYTGNTTPTVVNGADAEFALSDILSCESQVYSLAQLMKSNGMGDFSINAFSEMKTSYVESPMLVSTYQSKVPLNRITAYNVLNQGNQAECTVQTSIGTNSVSIYYNGPIITGSSPLIVTGGAKIYQTSVQSQNLGAWLKQ